MRTKTLKYAKFIVKLESNRKTESPIQIKTVSVFDNRAKKYWTNEMIENRGISSFLNINDVEETLNWNLNGNRKKYQFKWGQSSKIYSDGIAYIFD